jgi:signal peptidase II
MTAGNAADASKVPWRMRLRRWTAVLLSLVAMVGCDHATKHLAKAQLEGQPPREVLGSVLDFRYAENTDVAFNMLRFIPESARGPLLLATGAIAVLALLVALARRSVTGATRVALVLVLGGALGNYLDRVVRGYVVDFIRVPHWPVFNVADVLVTLGLGLLIWTSFRRSAAPASG